MLEASIGFLGMLILIFMRVPVALALIFVGFLGVTLLNGLTFENVFEYRKWLVPLSLTSRHLLAVLQNYELSVIPLFILMGNIVAASDISKNLYKASNAFLGHFRGGLSMATVVTCGAFSAISGSSLATAATMSKVALPEMKRYNYSMELASASVAAGGTLGILIPPSVILVIYGIITQQSIRDLFLAGLLPGILGIFLYLLAVKWMVFRNPEKGPVTKKASRKERLKALRKTWTVFLLFVLVMGGIYFGIFTPTEAAGIGSFGALIIAFITRKINIKSFIGVLQETVIITASLFSILVGATVFSDFIVRTGMPEEFIVLIEQVSLSPMAVIFLMLLIYLVLGMIFESLSMMLLTLPIFYPLVAQLGFDLVWFGIIVVVAIEISLITPPIGLNVFVLNTVMPEIKTSTIFKGIVPFWVADIIRLLLLTLIPAISLFLPQLIYH